MSVTRSLVSSTLMRVVSALLTFFNGVVFARILGPEFYGHYVLILSWISLCYFVSTAGLPTLVLREVALSSARGQKGQVKGVLIFSFFSFLCLLAFCILAYWLSRAVFDVAMPIGNKGWVVWATVLLWGASILMESATRGLGYTSIGQVGELLLRPGGTMVVFLLLYVARESGDIDNHTALIALFSATALSAAFSTAAFVWYQRSVVHEAPQFEFRSWIRGGIYSSGATILIACSYPLSFLMVGNLLGSADLGVYRVAYQVSVAAGMGLLAAKVVIAPQAASALSNGSKTAITEVYRRSIAACLLFSVPATVALLLFPQTILSGVFGQEYIGGANSTQILAVGVLINSLFGPIDVVLQIKRRDKVLFLAAVIRVAIFLSFVGLLTPRVGMVGTAVSQLMSTFIWCSIMLASFLRKPGKS